MRSATFKDSSNSFVLKLLVIWHSYQQLPDMLHKPTRTKLS